jgi:lipoate-protein ligase A
VHECLRHALRCLGAAAELAPRRRAAGVDAGACFASPAGGEILVNGRKVVGSAQLRQGTAMLQHGSILLDGNQAMVARVTRGAAPPDGSITLREALGRPVSWDEIAAAVATGVESRWGMPTSPRPEQLDAILERAAASGERFRAEGWNQTGAPTG